jgi:hypothetical protein
MGLFEFACGEEIRWQYSQSDCSIDTCQEENAACYILLIKKQLSYISYTCVVPNVEKVFDVDRMFYV